MQDGEGEVASVRGVCDINAVHVGGCTVLQSLLAGQHCLRHLVKVGQRHVHPLYGVIQDDGQPSVQVTGK